MPSFDARVAGAILLIVVLTVLAARGARLLVHGLVRAVHAPAVKGSLHELTAAEIRRRQETIETLASRILQAFIVVIGSLMVLGKLGLDIGPAIAGLGVVGIAVGFGAQSLVRDYFNGALILLENHYSLGDVVSIAGVTGTVEDISLRRTTLRDVDGVVHTVPNGEIKVASNQTRLGRGPDGPGSRRPEAGPEPARSQEDLAGE